MVENIQYQFNIELQSFSILQPKGIFFPSSSRAFYLNFLKSRRRIFSWNSKLIYDIEYFSVPLFSYSYDQLII